MDKDTILKLVGYVLEFIAFALAIYKFRTLVNSTLRLLFVVLAFIFLTETFASIKFLFFSSEGIEQRRNLLYYNVTTIITLLLYYGLYFENIRVITNKRIFLGSCVFAFCFYLVNIFFIQSGEVFHTYSFTIGSVCLCLGIVFYLKETVESEKIVVISKDPLFWISIGLFAFYIISIPFFAMYNYLRTDYVDILLLFRIIFVILNYFMYSCIIIGLICLKS
jgi:hypothetical protein